MLVPIAIAALGGIAYVVAKKKKASSSIGSETGKLTPERALLYAEALKSMKDPASLRKLAQTFRAEGLEPHAVMLEKRAALRELPKEVKEERRAIFRKAIASKNKEAVLKMADAYDNEGATGSADTLREYAEGL